MKGLVERINNFLYNYEKKSLIYLFILTLVFRTFHLIIIYKSFGTTKWIDDWEYLSMGAQIAEGNWSPRIETDGYQLMQVGPIVPILVAFFIRMFENPYTPMFIYNILVTSFIVPILFYLGKEVFNKNIGWMTAIWGVFYIDYFKYNPDILKEPTVFLFLPLTLLLLVKSIKNNIYWFYSFFSATSYVWLFHSDERYLVYLPIFALIFCLKKPLKLQQVFRSVVSWVSLIFFLMLPWGIQNYKVFGQVVVVSPRTTAFTSRVWGKDISGMNFSKKEPSSNYSNELKTFKTDKYAEKYGIAPHEYKGFELYARAFINFWQPAYFKATYIQHGARIHKWSFKHNVCGLIFYGIFLPFYLIGIVILLRKKNSLGLFLASIPIIHSLLHTYMVWPLERYRSPIVFIVVMIGMYTIFNIYEKRKKKIIK